MKQNSAIKTGLSFVTIILLLLLQVIFTSAQPTLPPPTGAPDAPAPGTSVTIPTGPNMLVDTTFVSVSSDFCGNSRTRCVVASFTSIWASHRDPRVTGNESNFATHLLNVLNGAYTSPGALPPDYIGGYYPHEAINASIQILS